MGGERTSNELFVVNIVAERVFDIALHIDATETEVALLVAKEASALLEIVCGSGGA